MAGGGSSTETVSMKGSVSLPVKKQNQQYQQQQQRQRALAPLSLVCVECGRPVALLFREYNKGNIRLGRCVSAAYMHSVRTACDSTAAAQQNTVLSLPVLVLLLVLPWHV